MTSRWSQGAPDWAQQDRSMAEERPWVDSGISLRFLVVVGQPVRGQGGPSCFSEEARRWRASWVSQPPLEDHMVIDTRPCLYPQSFGLWASPVQGVEGRHIQSFGLGEQRQVPHMEVQQRVE